MFRIIATVFALLAFITSTAHADPYVAPGHHEFHAWYQQIQVELKISNCCDEQNNDCGPVGQNYVDLGAMGTNVLLEDGQWHFAQTAKKYYVDTPDGGAHVCRMPASFSQDEVPGKQFFFYCIFLPQLLF